ncbi:MAG: response regulator [Anaerolineales bacterium]
MEIRTVLRANLEALEIDLDLIDVPTGEEAIVEVVGTGVDLMIADVGLPGLSGVELYRKLKSTYPDMKVIIITGLEDEEVRQEIAELDLEAFFFKPLRMPEFLNAVRISLGLDPVEDEPEEDLIKLRKKNLHKDVTNRIADLRGELGAISIVVIEDGGVIGAETGVMPDSIYETHVIPLLLTVFGATNKISSYLGNDNPKSTWYFSGDKYDVFWSHINAKYGMVIITNPIEQNNDLTWVLTTVELAIQEVDMIIAGLGDSGAKPSSKSSAKEQPEEDNDKSAAKVAKAELPKQPPKGSNGSSKKSEEAKKSQKELASRENVNENEVHEFWKAATLEEEIIRIDSPDSLSFEQAQKLGFIPNGEKSES